MTFASLVVLSYNRTRYLQDSLRTLWDCTHYPYQLIIVDDGSATDTQDYIYRLVRTRKVSTALFNTGHNMGIGIQVNRGFQIARGDYLFKLDADLHYTEGWLEEAVSILNEPTVGCLGLFRYWHQPCYFPEELIQAHDTYHEVKDFVGSAIGITRKTWERFGPWIEEGHMFSEDVEFKTRVAVSGLHMALPLRDLAANVGFGEQHSSLIKKIDWDHGKHEYNIPNPQPVLFP